MLVSISATHKNTSFETLEKLAASNAGLSRSLADAHDTIRGVVIVSTCNRFEAYFDLVEEDEWASPVPAVGGAIDQLAKHAGLGAREMRDSVEFAHGTAVAQHLFSVASGLESVALGEDEIAGQVRRSIETSRVEGTASSDLERLFQRATEASREVRNAAQVSQAGRSIVRLALQLASSRVSDWSATRVLLVGTGRYAAASLAAMRDLGVRDVRLYSISGRGRQFALTHDLSLIEEEGFASAVAVSDVIVTCTTASAFALDARMIERGREVAAKAAHENIPARQILIDLGLPRNIDPDVGALPGIELLDLETIRIHAPIDELSTLAYAHEIVRAAANRFATNSKAHDVSPAVVAVRAYIADIVDDEISRLKNLGKLDIAGERALLHLGGILKHRLTSQGQALAASGDGQRFVAGVESVLGITIRHVRPHLPRADSEQSRLSS